MTDEVQPAGPGRQIRLEPLAPGLWGVIIGVALALLAPLGGFLIGSILGVGSGGFSPLAVGVLIGILIGGVGVSIALVAAVRLRRHLRSARAE